MVYLRLDLGVCYRYVKVYHRLQERLYEREFMCDKEYE